MALGRGAPGAYGIEGQQGLCAGAPQGLGETDSTPEGLTQVFMGTRYQGRAETSEESRSDLPVDIGGSPGKIGGDCSSFWGEGHWRQRSQEQSFV